MILVVGGTGQLGGAITKLLLAQNFRVRVMTRTPQKASELKELGAEIVTGDLRDPASLLLACQGVNQLVATANAIGDKGDNNLSSVDEQGYRDLIDTAKEAEVSQFVYISVANVRADHPVDFFQVKSRIEQYLQDSGLNYTILRPSAFMEVWAEMIGKPIVEKGKTTLFGTGKNRANYISLEDVAQFVLQALTNPLAHRRIIEVGGPENLTGEEVVAIFEKMTGRKAVVRHMPVPVMKVMRVALKPVNPVASRLITAGIWQATSPTLTMDMTETLKLFPVKLTTLEQVAMKRFSAMPQREKAIMG